jgi:alpha-tubulin suppressor-like RCC1 family protein
LLHATAIAVGSRNVCAVLPDHTEACWGENTDGQLGRGIPASSVADTYAPVAVMDLTGVSSIAISGSASCSVLADTTLECWGTNAEGELGLGQMAGPGICNSIWPCATAPVKVPGLDGVLAVSLGANHTCALLTGGTVDCWGANYRGQLGNGTTDGTVTSLGGEPCNPTPTQVSGLTGVTAISCGSAHCCTLHTDTTVSCWGINVLGELGNGKTDDSASPVAVVGLSGVTAIAASDTHTCALLTGGTIECWGANSFGQLGNGTTDASLLPTPVPSLNGVKAISAGSDSGACTTCALLNNGTVWCWGLDTYGGLGSGGPPNAITTTPTPVQVTGITNATAISQGAEGGCALLADATIACWGNAGLYAPSTIPVLVSQ